MNKSYTIYDTNTGEILRNITIPKTQDPGIQIGESFLEGKSNDEYQYVLDGILVDRPDMAVNIDKEIGLADGVDLITITGIPNGTEAVVTKGFESLLYDTVTDGTLELASEYPAVMKVRLSLFPYVSQTLEVTFE